MKLTIERSALLRALGHIQNVVERRNTIPILSNVQLVADENGLSLTATDLDLALVEAVAAEVQKHGGTTAPARIVGSPLLGAGGIPQAPPRRPQCRRAALL